MAIDIIESVLTEVRKEIIDIAERELEFAATGEGIHMKKAGAPEGGRATRVGWERVNEYFYSAFGGEGQGKYHESDVKYAGGFWVSWCGLFTVYCLKTAGVQIGNWKTGGNISNLLKKTSSPQPGDVGLFQEQWHHCVIVGVDGDTLTTIDGNSGSDSTITKRTRRQRDFFAFYAVPE